MELIKLKINALCLVYVNNVDRSMNSAPIGVCTKTPIGLIGLDMLSHNSMELRYCVFSYLCWRCKLQ